MGLDMYLYASKYESKSQWRNNKEEVKGFYPSELQDLQTDIFERNFVSKETKYQVGYWRKFNALHSYIVENFADGEDKCQQIYLSTKDLEQILNNLKNTKNNRSKAKELLPTQDGFFFGSTQYDEWYWNDVEYSIRLFEEVLKLPEGITIYYQASW
jgi:hypothetical protein